MAGRKRRATFTDERLETHGHKWPGPIVNLMDNLGDDSPRNQGRKREMKKDPHPGSPLALLENENQCGNSQKIGKIIGKEDTDAVRENGPTRQSMNPIKNT